METTARHVTSSEDAVKEVEAALNKAIPSGKWMAAVWYVDGEVPVQLITHNFPRNDFCAAMAGFAKAMANDVRIGDNIREAGMLLPDGPRFGGNGDHDEPVGPYQLAEEQPIISLAAAEAEVVNASLAVDAPQPAHGTPTDLPGESPVQPEPSDMGHVGQCATEEELKAADEHATEEQKESVEGAD